MKIKKIAALCSQAGLFRLLNKTDREGVVTQWLGDGCAFYPLLGAPMMDEESLCTMLDIAGKKRENTIVRCDEMSDRVNANDLYKGDIILEAEGLTICHEGTIILPLRGENGIICIQAKYLEPLGDEKDLLELYSRKMAGETYVVVKAGMMIRAIIGQLQVKEELADKLESIAWACKEAASRRKAEEAAKENEEG